YFRRWMHEGLDGEPDGMPLISWFNCESTWWNARHLPNVLMVHYRDLKSDLRTEMERIAEFLSIKVRPELTPSLEMAATFTSMRNQAAELIPNIVRSLDGGGASFFQKGENERWTSILAASDIAEYEDRVMRRLDPDCASWLRAGRKGPQ